MLSEVKDVTEPVRIVAYKAVTEDGEITNLPHGVKVVSDPKSRGYEQEIRKQELLNRSKLPFVFVMPDSLDDLSTLDNKDLGYLLIMETYIDYLGMLKNTPDSTNPMTKSELKIALKISSDKTLRLLLKRLEEQKVIYQSKITTYKKTRSALFINPKYAFRKSIGGPTSKLSVDGAVKVFMSNLQQIYQTDTVKAAQIGFIYKLLPYLDYESNMLVSNPDERDPLLLERLTVTNIAEKVGMSRSAASTYLNNIMWGDQYVFVRSYLGQLPEARIKVNPWIFYRKSGLPVGVGAEFVCTAAEKERLKKK